MITRQTNKLQEISICNTKGEASFIYLFYCPGCKDIHHFNVGRKERPVWQFNDNMELPSFTPSLLYPDRRCHLFLTDGKIHYCDDCSHKLSGKVVELMDIPEELRW